MNQTERSRLARVITWLIIGILVVLGVRLLFAVLRLTASLALFFFTAIVPLILIGWIAMKLWDRYDRGRDTRL